MQVDWNIDEITELKKRAEAHDGNRVLAKHLALLEGHLVNHQKSRSFDLRKSIWEAVEELASKLDKLLETLNRK